MVVQNFVCCLYVAATLYAGMALYALTRPPNVVNRILALLMIICAIWVVTYQQELTVLSVAEKTAWMRGRYFAIPFLAPLWVMLTAHLADSHQRVRPAAWCALFLIPVLTTLLSFTSQSHSFFRYAFATATEAPVSALVYRSGPFGILYEAYTAGLSILGFVLLTLAWRKADTKRRRNQLMFLLISGSFPIMAHGAFMLSPSAFDGITPAPLLLLPASAVLAVAIFWHGLTDVAPFIVRRLLFDINHDGTVVTNTAGRIMELNHTATRMLAHESPSPQGMMTTDLPAPWNVAFSIEGEETVRFERPGPPSSTWFERTRIPVIEKGHSAGWMFVLQDISDRVALQTQQIDEVRRAFEAARLRQWGALLRDLHDGLGSVATNISFLSDRALKTTDPAEKDVLLGQIADFATDGNAELRAMMNMLDCPEMTWSDIFSEARRFSELILSAHNIGLHLAVEGPPGRVPAIDNTTSLLRIIKEAVHNAAKHSGATEVSISFIFEGSILRLIIRDNGTWKGEQSEGRGIGHIRQRVAALRGTIDIQTSPFTCLTCILPAVRPTPNPTPL